MTPHGRSCSRLPLPPNEGEAEESGLVCAFVLFSADESWVTKISFVELRLGNSLQNVAHVLNLSLHVEMKALLVATGVIIGAITQMPSPRDHTSNRDRMG